MTRPISIRFLAAALAAGWAASSVLADSTVVNATNSYSYSVPDSSLADIVLHHDNGTYGPQIEFVHAYYNYWPTGVGVASDGTVFTSYPRGDYNYTLAVVDSTTTEAAWPDLDWNTPPSLENVTNPGFSIATDKFLLIQSVVVDGLDRVWALDVGRPIVDGATLLAAVPGGPKLVGFYTNGTNFANYTFPASVVFADSSINDVRIDSRGGGYAYIPDQASTHPGIIVLDLETGESWRHLDGHVSVSPDPDFVPTYNGIPYYVYPAVSPYTVQTLGTFAADGIALSADGEYLYYTPLSNHHFYRVPTSYLKVQPSGTNPYAALLANRAVESLGEFGSHADGLETDSSGYIYAGGPEINGITRYNHTTGINEAFVRNPVIQWPDTLSVVTLDEGSYVYFTSNQLWLSSAYNNGTDGRTLPGAMFRVAIEAEKATQTD